MPPTPENGQKALESGANSPDIEDYERLQQDRVNENLVAWGSWLEESHKLAADILERRDGEPLDVDALWEPARDALVNDS